MERTAFIFLVTIPLSASAAIDLEKLKALFDNNQSRDAYEYALSDLDHSAGNPVFDYYYGVTAIDNGFAADGVTALTRVLKSDPEHHLARLELARGYFKLADYARARKEFEIVLGADPPENVLYNINRFLDAIARREFRSTTVYTASLNAGAGTDSNVNSGPDDASAFSQFVGFDPAVNIDPSLRQHDTFYAAGFDLGVSSPLGTDLIGFGNLQGDIRRYDEQSVFDTNVINADAGLTLIQGKDNFTADLQFQNTDLDGSEYRRLTALNTRWQRYWSSNTGSQVYLQRAHITYPDQPLRDIDNTMLGVSIEQRLKLGFSPVLSAGLFIAHDAATDSSTLARELSTRDYHGINLGSGFTLNGDTALQVAVTYQTSDYAEADSSLVNPVVRNDNYLFATADLDWKLDKHWSVIGSLQYSNNRSNIDADTYQRTQLSVNLQYDFFQD